ncbi:hypothetical protein [Sporichthya sp.]|uniref:hypothetical protein n=1 Tax=Sporichthya sp. TaxID=65475 RepID=UPI0017A93F6F|nr:hypothetical protein [Sporichthya sp.]MBA3742422.1 hypothetical protein [Sporichthya sp.]
MTVVLDAGALLAVERRDRELIARIKLERVADREPVTHGGVLGQVWRGGTGRQALLAAVLAGVEVRPLDEGLGRRAGVLLGLARRADVVDAGLILLAHDGDEILTSDPEELRALARAAGLHVDIVPV